MSEFFYPDRFPDADVAMSGAIPWSADEFWEVAEYEQRLTVTPKDDWDRRPERFAVDNGAGDVHAYRFNPDNRTNQVMSFLVSRYRDADPTTAMSHMTRYMKIKEFLGDFRSRLVADDLLRPAMGAGPDDIASALIEVLAVSRYPATHANRGGHPVPMFAYDEVVPAAKRRMRDEDPK